MHQHFLLDGGLMSQEKETAAIDALRATVRDRYGSVAQRVADSAVSAGASCCGPATGSSGCCGASTESWDPITSNLYDDAQAAGVPMEAMLASLGCGNPTALAALAPGEVVLDLGSGGGIDVLLSAKRVGPTGKAYGLDMTDEMLALANENKERAGATNVEFLRGHIEQIPLPAHAVDVIISNCVINLSGDKRAVLAESFRVLKPGGRFAVSDVVVRGAVPDDVKRSMELWIGCVAGALEEQEFLSLLADVGFVDASIEPTRIYTAADALAFLQGSGLDAERFAREVDGRFMGAFVRATKPGAPDLATRRTLVADAAVEPTAAGASCCGPECCS
jgi:arsenite methyltransferase